MKLKILTFEDGTRGYATGSIEIKKNKRDPVSIDEIKLSDNSVEEIFKDIDKFDIVKTKNGRGFKKVRKNK